MMADFRVRVTRCEDVDYDVRHDPDYDLDLALDEWKPKKGGHLGDFESKVYAIDVENDQFLVYDPGEGVTHEGAGFEWVSFLHTWISAKGIETLGYGQCCEHSDRYPVVELVE